MFKFLCFGRTRAARKILSTINISTLRRATGNFSNDEQIGEGGSAHVFKGTLETHGVVAVKRLKPLADRDADYDREVGILSRLKHPHIINMVGCCAHRDEERIIVYELMPLRTLFDWLYARKTGELALDWGTRMRIGAGVARGLSYLHNEANPQVIYRDLKPTNVLLDEWHHPKISDFGIALSVSAGDQSSTVTTNELMGTHPYFAPEASLTNTVSPKSDVYSFGVLLLEIIAGRVPLDPKYPRYIDKWVEKRENFSEVPDPEMNGQFQLPELVKAMTLVNHCMKMRPTSRPDMSVVERAMNNLSGHPNVGWPVEFNIEEDEAGPSTRRTRNRS